MDLSKIKLIISEVDGVVTEHLTGVGEMNMVMFKQYYMKDFEAINEIKKHWKFAFLSSDASISLSMCKKRNIPFFHAERSKAEVYNKILPRYRVTADQVLYIGTSYWDIKCMKLSAASFCTEDSVTQVKNVADIVLPYMGGTGVLCAVYDVLYSDLLQRQRQE